MQYRHTHTAAKMQIHIPTPPKTLTPVTILPQSYPFPISFFTKVVHRRHRPPFPLLRSAHHRLARLRCCSGNGINEVEDGKTQSKAYPFKDIEPRWQRYWEENKTFRTPDEIDTSKPKFYILDMFPYPRLVHYSFSSSSLLSDSIFMAKICFGCS